MNTLLILLIGIMLSLVVLEALKHLIAKKTASLFFFIVIILIIVFSYTDIIEKGESFRDKKYLQTGATALKKIKGKIENSDFINSTLKSDSLLDEKDIFKD